MALDYTHVIGQVDHVKAKMCVKFYFKMDS